MKSDETSLILSADLCCAIHARRLVGFYYEGEYGVVEPHLISESADLQCTLSAWLVSGHGKGGPPNQWREYVLSKIADMCILEQTFVPPRQGYEQVTGKKFYSVVCKLELNPPFKTDPNVWLSARNN